MSFRTRVTSFFVLIVVVPWLKWAGAAMSSGGKQDQLIASPDSALYVAAHEGKNRTVTAEPKTANVSAGE